MTSPTFTCPSCGFVVFEEEPGSHEVCLVCGWEHDLVQWDDPHYRGGANDASLVEAQTRSVERFPHGTWTVHGRHRDPWWRPLMQVEVTAGRDAVAIPKWGERCVPYWSRSPLGFDTVLTNVWWDGPLSGIANLDGQPHQYWIRDGYEDVYDLQPVDDEMVRLELEALQIWQRWMAAPPPGTVVTERHSALPADRARCDFVHAELERRREALCAQRPARTFARGVFDWPATPIDRVDTWFAVRWEIQP